MDNLVQQLRSLARSEHDDLSLGSAAADEIESLRQQVADKHQLFMCASANYDRLAEQLAECERERDYWEHNANEMNAHWKKQLATVTAERDELAAELKKMNRAYVNLMENGRGRIIMLGGDCDPVDMMESNDPYLRESRAALAKAERREAGQLGTDKTGEV